MRLTLHLHCCVGCGMIDACVDLNSFIGSLGKAADAGIATNFGYLT